MTQDISYFESGYIDDNYFVYTADAEAHLSVTSSIRAFVSSQSSASGQVITANLVSTTSMPRAILDGTTRYIDPYIISGSNYSGIGFDSTIKKFGASLRFDARSIGATIDVGPVFANGQFVALNASSQGNNYTISSTDGVTWTSTLNNLPTRDPFLSKNFLKYLNGHWVTNIGTNFYTSTDAVNWTTVTSNVNLRDITWTGNYYIGINNDSVPSLEYSTDLSSWTPKFSYTNQTINNGIKSFSINYVDPVSGNSTPGYLNLALGHVVDNQNSYGPTINYNVTRQITNYTGPGALKTKGVSGYPIINANFDQLRQSFLDAASDGTTLVLVGTSGLIYTVAISSLVNNTVYNTTVNTVSLTARTSNTTDDISEVKFLNNVYIARTTTGKILHSTDGITWATPFVPQLSTPTITTPWVDGTIDIPGSTFYTTLSYGNNQWVAGEFISSDSVNWSRIDYIGQIPNQQPSVYYEPGQYLNQWRTLDFWLYVTPSDLTSITGVLWQSALDSKAVMNINFDTNNGALSSYSSFSIIENDTNGNSLGTYTANNAFQSGQWNHIRVVHDNELGAIFVNGSRVEQFTPQGSLGFSNTPMYIGRQFGDVRYARPAYYIDEFLLTRDLLSSPNDTSYSVPTEPWSNGPNVLALLHFNNDIDDDNLPWNGAYLQSTFSLDYVPSAIRDQAQLTATSSITVNVSVVKSAQIHLSSTTTEYGQIKVQKSATANLSTTSQLTASVRHVSTENAQLTSTSQLIANVAKIKNAQASLTTTSTFTVSYNRYRLVTGQGAFVSHSTVQSTPVKTVGINVNLTDTTHLTAGLNNVATTRQAQANLSSQSTFTASFGLTGRIDTSIIWYIGNDLRTWQIEYENRDWLISPEI